jgi:hypothetical protein
VVAGSAMKLDGSDVAILIIYGSLLVFVAILYFASRRRTQDRGSSSGKWLTAAGISVCSAAAIWFALSESNADRQGLWPKYLLFAIGLTAALLGAAMTELARRRRHRQARDERR